MKIGILCHSSCGGSARIGVESAKELSLRGHEVHLFMRTPSFFPVEAKNLFCHTLYRSRAENEHAATLVREWPEDELEAMAKLVVSVQQERGLDILHVHYLFPFVYIVQKVRHGLTGASPFIVATIHGTDVDMLASDTDQGIALDGALDCFDAITTVSRSHRRLFAQRSGLRRKLEIIPNFVDLSRFRLIKQHVVGIRPVIVHVSNFRSIKAPGGVVEIFDRINDGAGAELRLLGEGEETASVKEMVKKRGLEKDVVFYGLLTDISPVLGDADLLIVTSRYESFCLSALEAMACGIPVVAPHVGGLPEVVIHGKTGFLFPDGDYAVAADFAHAILSDPVRHRAMSVNAVNRAQEFDGRKIVKRYEDLYKRTLRGRS